MKSFGFGLQNKAKKVQNISVHHGYSVPNMRCEKREFTHPTEASVKNPDFSENKSVAICFSRIFQK